MVLSIFYTIVFLAFCYIASFAFFLIFLKPFNHLRDKGYTASRLGGILALCYVAWLAGHVIPISTITVWGIFLAFIALALFMFFKQKKHNIDFLKKNKKDILIKEAIFLTSFVFFLAIRFSNPDLWHPYMGGEKPMDFAFISSLVKTNSLPPYDPWLSGHTINYYYFGQYIIATIVKLLLIPAGYFYNIFLPFLFATTALISYTISYNLTKKILFGIFGILFTVGIGNLAQVKLLFSSLSQIPPINAWYWNATRIMPNFEINEFPFFSFLYADPHSHLIGLPISLLALLIGIETIKIQNFKKTLLYTIILGILLGIIRITNIWDYPTFAGLTIVFLFANVFIQKEDLFFKKVLNSIILTATLIGASLLSILPFLLHYKTGALGLSLYSGPQTKIEDYLLIHGLFLFIFSFFILVKFITTPLKKISKKQRLLLLIPIAFITVCYFGQQPFLMFLSVLLFFAFYNFLSPFSLNEKLMIFLAMVALALTAIPDIIDIKLGLGRMNTVFKFYYQAWILFALTSSYFLYAIVKLIRNKKYLLYPLLSIFGILLIAAFSYIPTATYGKINDRMSPVPEITLDGEAYMKSSVYYDKGEAIHLKDDYDAILWLRQYVKEPKVIVEATTPIYRWGSRISIYTGNPTILGWDWHEIAHRQYDSPDKIHERASDIQAIYESTDQLITLPLLAKYNVSYLYVGQLEKIYYNTAGLENIIANLPQRFTKVYSTPSTTIYRFN